MFEEATNDAHHAHALALAGNPWSEAADASNDQFNLHSGLGGFIEKSNDARIHQGVHLGDDVTAAACLGMVDFTADQGLHSRAQADGSDEQFAERLLLGETGEVVEQLHQVSPQFRPGTQQTEIGVQT